MVKYKEIIVAILILFFLLFSFYPTIFELSRSNKLADPNREFILEHNYYWPDFNLYLSKIRQGWEGNFFAVEKYTTEPHAGSLIQEFYVILGHIGKAIGLDPNLSYQLGRLILSPLLLIMIWILVSFFFQSFLWQLLAFIIVIISGSFPRIYTDPQGSIQVGRFMEWWSNIDSLQRITFIPHILFGQVVSFFLLYKIVIKQSSSSTQFRVNNRAIKFVLYILLGNLVGLVFPPSLITLNGVLLLTLFVRFANPKVPILKTALNAIISAKLQSRYYDQAEGNQNNLGVSEKFGTEDLRIWKIVIFVIFTLPSLLYLFFITKQLPWSALVDFHRTHPMMIPLDQYILGTGPIFFLGTLGAILAILKREKRFQPLILWTITTLGFASFFSIVKEQSPLRFTQTGLFIPLGILGAYFFQKLWNYAKAGDASGGPPARTQNIGFEHLMGVTSGRTRVVMKSGEVIIILFYIILNLFIMKVSLNWQTNWIGQRIGANIPDVPYPPQTVYPLKDWMDGIRWLRDNTNHNDVVLAEITAGNYIPSYSGNFVYFGQSNTADYERKQIEIDKFFKGEITPTEAENFLKKGRVKYIFFSIQEKGQKQNLDFFYPFLKSKYTNSIVTIYGFNE